MDNTPHRPEDTRPATQSISGHTIGAIIAVFVVNAAILGYAISISIPREKHVEPTPSAQVAPVAVDPVPVAEPPAAVADAVINPIMLPEAGVVRGMYLQHCAACHGLEGRGDGPAAMQLYPAPRDFTGSPFRFTPLTGSRDEVIAALERSIVEGVPHSSMPGFGGVLSEPVIAGLARYVHDLHPPAARMDLPKMDLGARPPTTAGLIERGRQVYGEQGCVSCHGEQGHGDGETARTLLDAVGRPILPADLASGLYKAGRTPEDVARTVLQGVPGTPMIGYEAALTRINPDGTRDLTEAWALVAYMQSLRPKVEDPGISSGAELRVHRAVDDEMLTNPAHVAWLGVEPERLALRPIWNREETILSVDARAVKSEDRIALCLDWRDPTRNDGKDLDTFPDAAAVMFSLGREVPAIPMGVQLEGYTPDVPVNIWHWQAYRQKRAWGHATRDATAAWELMLHPPPGTVVAGDGVCVEAQQPLPSYCTALDAENIYNHPDLNQTSVLESNAKGFGTLSLQPPQEQAVQGSAAWSNGLWRVVMVRDLKPSGDGDVEFEQHERMPVSFAIWDGEKGDRAGSKLISGWHWLVMEPTTTANAARGTATKREAAQ